MPKENFTSLTVSEDFIKQIDEAKKDKGYSRQEFLTEVLREYASISTQPYRIISGENIGSEHPVYVIAEIGINHNGSVETAKKLIDMAVDAGCDAVKFQKRTPEICVPEEQKKIMRETPWGTMTYLEYKKRIEFGKEDYEKIDKYCKEKGIVWFASPWDIPSVDFLEEFDIPCYKIASACLTDEELLNRIKEKGKPVILSTGMSTIEQIKKAVNILGEENLILMHCTSTYPTNKKEQNLNVIKEFRRHFNCPIGYSGHESGITSTLVAASLGACVLERHITLDRAMYGSDQAASLEIDGLKRICSFVKSIPLILGDGEKIVYDSEKSMINKLRKK